MPGTAPHLERLARAVKRRALQPADIDVLRRELERTRLAAGTHDALAMPVKGLAVLEAQLADLSERLGERALEPGSFAELPASVRRRVLTRLQSAALQFGSERATANTPPKRRRADPAFRCATQHKRCCEMSPDGRLWCHIALAVCLVRTLLPLIEKRGG